ncbi:MAG TPA: cysteine peptidase family C39 domain-containing protein, partial [Burkholderiales bacterium]|nr:cysteine peptidase family C39 domain-containing protein [Burkholderiales bacterium]
MFCPPVVSRCALVLVATALLIPCFATATSVSSTTIQTSQIRIAPGFEEPFVATGPTSPEEDKLLAEAIAGYRQTPGAPHFTAFDPLLKQYPNTAWRAAISTNLGLAYYQTGHFSKAINAWEDAWKAGSAATEPKAKAMVDRALGELLRMHARIGHADRLTALFDSTSQRALSGPATEAYDGAKQGLWKMSHEPGVAYLCGPMALKNLLLSTGATASSVQFIDAYRSGKQGVSLAEVAKLANEAKLSYRLVHRDSHAEIPIPALVHWKISHFAAIVGKQGDYYHVKDPTFGDDLWITRDALASESSGYFLIPTAAAVKGFREVTLAEAGAIRGMGFTGSSMPSATTPQDDKAKPGDCNRGMCGYNFTEMTVSLNLSDTPVGYRPPKGPAAFVTLTYNQREASQPANFSFFNVGPKWTLNWLSFIQDNPGVGNANVTRYVAGGGSVSYTGYNSGSGAYKTDRADGSVLVKTASNPIRYERRLADGSVEIYGQSNGAPLYPRLVFLTHIVDAAGNTLALNYDAQMRLTALTDATGRNTTFSYQMPGWPLLVTTITDPFGRSAQLQYDNSGRLTAITDVLGLTSQFQYNGSSLINAMTTPYGVTRFDFGDNGNQRYLQATDPLGHTERLEYRQQAPGIADSEPASLIPQGIVAPFNIFMSGRNTFYWDKHAYRSAAGDYTQARIKHWTHSDTNVNVTANTIESIKYPLESRIWFNYPGQPNGGLGTAVIGSLDKPIRRARVLDDGVTQLTQYSYNGLGNLTGMTDPLGRHTQMEYAANQVDLIAIRQQTAAGLATIAQLTYDPRHRPLTYTDAAGQTTRYAYNAAGQLTSIANALGQTTRYDYDALG